MIIVKSIWRDVNIYQLRFIFKKYFHIINIIAYKHNFVASFDDIAVFDIFITCKHAMLQNMLEVKGTENCISKIFWKVAFY